MSLKCKLAVSWLLFLGVSGVFGWFTLRTSDPYCKIVALSWLILTVFSAICIWLCPEGIRINFKLLNAALVLGLVAGLSVDRWSGLDLSCWQFYGIVMALPILVAVGSWLRCLLHKEEQVPLLYVINEEGEGLVAESYRSLDPYV